MYAEKNLSEGWFHCNARHMTPRQPLILDSSKVLWKTFFVKRPHIDMRMMDTFHSTQALAGADRNVLHAFNSKSTCKRPAARTHFCRAADSSPSSTSGSFNKGPGRVGVASAAQPSSTSTSQSGASTRPSSRPLASTQTIKDAQSMAKLFLQGELGSLFTTGVRRPLCIIGVSQL